MALDHVERHSVFLMDRGGTRRLDEIKDISLVRWGRVRDDISEATVALSAAVGGWQEELLRKVEPGRHEICIFRDDERVWEGPITLYKATGSVVTITAKDVMHYANRRALRQAYDSRHPLVESAVARAARVLRSELARKEQLGYNILSHLRTYQYPTDARSSRYANRFTSTVWAEVDEMAQKGGIDYTVVGRSIILWDTSRPIGETRTVTQADFLGELSVTVYGMEGATRAISTDGEGRAGIAGGEDPFYGEIELLFTEYDEDEAKDDEAPPSQKELEGQAKRNLEGRLPTPLKISVPEGSTLNPNGSLSMSDLVPGVHMPVLVNTVIRTVSQMQKLDKMQVEETPAGEVITVSMTPATASDDVEEE